MDAESDITGLIEKYVLALCDEEETRAVEQLAAQDEALAKQIRSAQHGLTKYCQSCREEKAHRAGSWRAALKKIVGR